MHGSAGFRSATLALFFLAAAGGVAGQVELRPEKTDARTEFTRRLTAAHGDAAALDAALDREILACQPLLEEGLDFRRRTADLAARLHAKIEKDQPLDGADLDTLHRHIQDGLGITRRIFAVIDIHANWCGATDRDFAAAGFKEPPPAALRAKGALFSLAGSLFLYDTYRLYVVTLAGDEKIRRVGQSIAAASL